MPKRNSNNDRNAEDWKHWPCKLWPEDMALDKDGYGRMKVAGQVIGPHVLALEERLGRRLAPGMLANHYCDVRRCYEGMHLYEGSHEENMQDMVDRGRAASGDNNGRRRKARGLPGKAAPVKAPKSPSEDSCPEVTGW